MSQKRLSFVFTVIALFSVSVFSQTTTPEAKKSNTRPDPPAAKEPFDNAAVSEMAKQCVSLDTASGLIVIEMYPESAPESVRNFLNLVATGLLDTTTFSRVVPNFVIQGGDLYTREGEMTRAVGLRARKVVPDEPNSIRHERGVISMARGDEPNTATTNFFILVDTASYLDGKFAAFGRVTKGMDVVDKINQADVTDEKPADPVRIKKASVAACAGETQATPAAK